MHDRCFYCQSRPSCSVADKHIRRRIRHKVIFCPQRTLYQQKMYRSSLEELIDTSTDDSVVYVGHGQFWVRFSNRSKNPDFVIKNKDKVIELFGDFWHKDDDPSTLIEEYNNAGYDCLVLWEKEIREGLLSSVRKINRFASQLW